MNGTATDDDTLNGGRGGDEFDAGGGADTIQAVDNEADQISCGRGDDKVFFDQGLDTFLNANACEDKRPSWIAEGYTATISRTSGTSRRIRLSMA